MPTPTTDRLDLVWDADLLSMESRAWREAVRSWQEYRECEFPSLRALLRDAAVSADEFYHRVRREVLSRGL